jgi:hypothetical protein
MSALLQNWCGALAVVLLTISAVAVRGDEAAKTLDIYCIDISASVGNATLIVSPSGETMMLDAGPPRSETRTLDVMKQTGVKQLDFLVNTHFCADHVGATAALAQQIPIRHFVDHGRSAEYQRDDEWWKARRGPWFKPGMGKDKDALYESYLKAVASGEQYLAPLLSDDVDTLVLGCTHYPLIRPLLRRVAPPRVEIVDSAESTAAKVVELLKKDLLGKDHAQGKPGGLRCYATDSVEKFRRLGGNFLGRPIENIELIDIEK